MSIIKIDNKEYDTDTLSEEAKKQLSALRVVDAEIQHLKVRMGIAQTARNVHVQSLKTALKVDPMGGDIIKLGQ